MQIRPLALAAAALAALAPTAAAAAGAISVANVGANATFTVTLTSGTVTTAATNLNAADWSDTTGTATGWNGTLALQQFQLVTAWSGGTSTALLSTSAGTYTSTTHDTNYKVTVTSDAGGTTLVIAWTGTESGSGTATKGTAFAVGTKGLTITFKTATTYLATDKYTVKADVLATSALVFGGAGTCATTTGAVNTPTWTNTAATVTGGATTAFGTAVKFLTSTNNTGAGAWTCTPKAKISVDANSALSGSYTATAQYSVVSGP